MNLEDQMNVARDADRISKKDTRNAKKRARRAAKKAVARMNAQMAVTPSVPAASMPNPMRYPKETPYDDGCAAQSDGLLVDAPVFGPASSAKQLVDAAGEPAVTQRLKAALSGRKNTFIRVSTNFTCEICGCQSRLIKIPLIRNNICLECYTMAAELNHLRYHGSLYASPAFILSICTNIRANGGTLPDDFVQVEASAKAATKSTAALTSKLTKVSVKRAVLDCFYLNPGTVFSIQGAVTAIQSINRGMNESSIRVWITDFIKDGSIKKVGQNGRKLLLRSGVIGKFARDYIVNS